MDATKKFMLELGERDLQILRLLAGEAGVPKAVILRWALRWYALNGPWTADKDAVRAEVVEPFGLLEVGPRKEGFQ